MVVDRFGEYFGPCQGMSAQWYAPGDTTCNSVSLQVRQVMHRSVDGTGNFMTKIEFRTDAATASADSFFIKMYFSHDATYLEASDDANSFFCPPSPLGSALFLNK